jgi:serine/threonine protein kinase
MLQRFFLLLVLVVDTGRAFLHQVPTPHGVVTAKNNRLSSAASLLLLWGTSPPADTGVTSLQRIGTEIGAGSYGKVHSCTTIIDGGKEQVVLIGKRPLTMEEVRSIAASSSGASEKEWKEKVQRCQHYWDVEKHCFLKLGDHPQLPRFRGFVRDSEERPWMLFDTVFSTLDKDTEKPAPSLKDLMKLDHDKHHDKKHPHHLYYVQKALGLPLDQEVSLGETLDAFFESFLHVLRDVHAKRIVHRDVKPGNLLVAKDVYLIDFGSAADLEPTKGSIFGQKKFVGLEDNDVVAISPIYAAPEVFVERNNKPENFDVYSAALIFCQLLFNFLDERTDAGFHQQLAACDWNLDVWLQQELASKVRPKGLEEALLVLSERPGLWRLLQEMFRPKPWDRIDSELALKQFQLILKGSGDIKDDGPFLQSVLETFEICDVVDLSESDSSSPETIPFSRPLHFVASFKRNTPLGLILAEVNSGDEDDDGEMDEVVRQQWVEATRGAVPGQVFVKGVVPGGQADGFGIFEIGDQLQGVGELPVAQRGFGKVVELLGKQPSSSKYVTLHFDRKKLSTLRSDADGTVAPAITSATLSTPTFPLDSGAWSVKGRRQSQEDRFGEW